jgi:3',5'-cyclic-AMP phosphodiesterase
MFDGDNEKSGDWVIPGAWVHIDARRIVELFHQHKNVKLCLSGHIHLFDRVLYNGVTYICDGAVCGRWWARQLPSDAPRLGLGRPLRRRLVRTRVPQLPLSLYRQADR